MAYLHGLDPQAYLRYALEYIVDHPINGLLPWNNRSLHARLEQRVPT